MTLGYDQPLYVLPFDHRHSYVSQVFGFEEPLTAEQIAEVTASKQIVYEGFQQAIAAGAPKDKTSILVDEEFGAAILRDARRQGFHTAMSTEKSGQHEFDFEYGDDFAQHIEDFDPTFTKVLVRYNPEGDSGGNQRQLARLKRLSDYLRPRDHLFMFEMLVPAEPEQLAKAGDKAAYDRDLRPGLMIRSIREIQDAGVEPDVWKIEGLDRREDCVKIVETVRRDGRDRVGSIILGRGENEQKVVQWLSVAATVPGFIGFAVGRSTFLQTIVEWRAKETTPEAGIAEIARRFGKWVDVFQQARDQ
jgi:myo-inositol catabolism protein IolC